MNSFKLIRMFGSAQCATDQFSHKLLEKRLHIHDVTTGCLEHCAAAAEANQSLCLARGNSHRSRVMHLVKNIQYY
jgi:hypothetical protein